MEFLRSRDDAGIMTPLHYSGTVDKRYPNSFNLKEMGLGVQCYSETMRPGMASWQPWVLQTFQIPRTESLIAAEKDSASALFDKPGNIQTVAFELQKPAKQIRLECRFITEPDSPENDRLSHALERYANHLSIREEQKELLRESFCKAMQTQWQRGITVHFFDPENEFRGRWDPAFRGWKVIGEREASDGFVAGRLPRGVWTAQRIISSPLLVDVTITLRIEWAEEADPRIISVPYDFSVEPEEAPDERWVVGELHTHTARSVGDDPPQDIATAYQALGYHFVALTDHDAQPISALSAPPPLGIIRGQEIETFYGHALLLGTQEWVRWAHESGIPPLSELIYKTHGQGGLFCVLHPFASSPAECAPAWAWPNPEWFHVDLLEIWSGLWKERFPEIMKTFDLWDTLLNQGHRIFGTCGKGGQGKINETLVEQLPKTLALSEGVTESRLLAALKLGHFYATREPAVDFFVDSEYGGAQMGDELRLPVAKPYLLHLHLSGVGQSAFVRIKTNQGIYCEMPLCSVRDSKLKFIETALPETRWYRVEIYRYGRILDDLLAFSNPIFVRGMISV